MYSYLSSAFPEGKHLYNTSLDREHQLDALLVGLQELQGIQMLEEREFIMAMISPH